jgi:4-amino-4-deoxy-L-arabinose transferase-like glycosyltransferase
MSLPAFTFAAVALATAAFLCAATLRLRGTSFAVGAYILAWAGVVGLGEVLSLTDAVGRTGYVAGAAALLAGAAAAWQWCERPLPRLPRPRLAGLRAHPELVLLGVVVAAALGYEAFLVVATPSNNGDALAYHLPRVVAWLQQGHVGYFDAATQRATAFPGNAELGILWTVALLGRDTLAALPQFIAEVAVLACVYGSGRRLGFGRPAAAFAALLTATLGQVALQSTTAQNDLVNASFVAAAAYFVLGHNRRELPLAGLAAALAVGTKLTGLLALPLLAAITLAVLPRRRVVTLVAWTAAAFVGFGSFWYVENTIQTHHPLGVIPEADAYRPAHTPGAVVSTAARISWRFIDFTGLEPPRHLVAGFSETGSKLFALAHIDPNPPGATANGFSFTPSTRTFEDSSYFGLLGFLLLLPLSAAFVAGWVRRRTIPARGAVALALPLFVLAVALTQSYNSWLGRFMLVPVAVAMPLSAWLYERRLRLLTLVAALIGAVSLTGTHLHNVAKPVGLSGETPIWAMTHAEAETLQVGGGARCILQLVDRAVPPNARLGVVLGNNDPSYPLYGPRLQRRLVTLPPSDPLRASSAQGLRWVVVGPDQGLLAGGKAWHAQRLQGRWQLLTRGAPGIPIPHACVSPARLLAASRGERNFPGRLRAGLGTSWSEP